MQQLLIRPATTGDIVSLSTMMVAFRDYLGQSSPSEVQFKTSLEHLLSDPATSFLLAIDSNRTIGYAQCRYRYSAWVSGLEVELEDLWIAPEARRKAVGRRLLTEVISLSAGRGCQAIALSTNELNAAALQLYESLGFRCERLRWQGGRQLWLQRLIASDDR